MEMSSPDKKFVACVFDLYDTLVFLNRDGYDRKSEDQAALAGLSAEQFKATWKQLVKPSNEGRYPTTRDRVVEALKRHNVSGSTQKLDEIAEQVADIEHRFLRHHSELFSGSVELLANLRRAGFKLGMVTNASPSVWNVIDQLELEPLFDQVVVSSSVGIRKPDPGIYYEALRQLNVWADQTAFVGDGNDRELEGAHRVGMTTIKINHDAFRAVQSEQSDEECVDLVADSLEQIPRLLNLE